MTGGAEDGAGEPPLGSAHSLTDALAPLLERVGGHVVAPSAAGPDDVAVTVGGCTVHVRLTADEVSPAGPAPAPPGEPADLSDGLARLIAHVEQELGGELATLPRARKQEAVRLLEERGAFEMRRSAETVAEALGVTRFTVYNYLNRQSSA